MTIGKKITLMILALLSMTAGVILWYYASFTGYFNSNFGDTLNILENSNTKPIEADKPLTILLMGVDMDQKTRGGKWEGGRSDSMILVTINPKTKKTTMVSLSRDIMVAIANADGSQSDKTEKLNHSYAYGQAAMAKATIEKMLDISIDRYVEINMDGLMDLVDVVGGIEVTNPLDITISIADTEPDYTATVKPGGPQLINGKQALVYSRMRHDDPEGDIGRQKRQREVIQALLTKLLKLDSLTQYKSIISKVKSNLQTDLVITTDTIRVLLGYKDSLDSIESYELAGESQMIDNLSYQIPTAEEVFKIQNILKESIGESPSTVLKTNVQVAELRSGQPSPVEVRDAYTDQVLVAQHASLPASTSTTASSEDVVVTPLPQEEVPIYYDNGQ